MGYRRLQVEGDNTSVIQALRGEIIKPWTIANIIEDSEKFLSVCETVNIRHTFREGNRATDWAANAGYIYGKEMEWDTSPSLELDYILKVDILGVSLKRRAP